jgi:hypothetical protein
VIISVEELISAQNIVLIEEQEFIMEIDFVMRDAQKFILMMVIINAKLKKITINVLIIVGYMGNQNDAINIVRKNFHTVESIYAIHNHNNIFVIRNALIQIVMKNVVNLIFLMGNLIKEIANVFPGKVTVIIIPVEKNVLLELNQMDVIKHANWNMDMI